MASRAEHNAECIDKLGDSPERRLLYDEVNRRLDQFSHYPDWEFLKVHRRFLHHREGIEYFYKKYGKIGGKAAELHVLRDLGHIPDAVDYYNGKLDGLGQKIEE